MRNFIPHVATMYASVSTASFVLADIFYRKQEERTRFNSPDIKFAVMSHSLLKWGKV